MGSFHLHRSQRVERLVTALGDLLEKPVGGPFEPELVVVPGRGMSVWLSRELAGRFGIWATPLVYPRAFVERIVALTLGEAALGPETLSEDAMEWAIHAELPKLLDAPEFADIQRYLEGDERGMRVARLSSKLAGVFDQYLTYRPDWVRSFEGGGTAGVPVDQRFQALLFRRVSERLRRRHVAHVEDKLLERLDARVAPPGLPRRVSLFGLSTLPPLFVRVLVALSRHVEVHFFQFWAGAPSGPEEAALFATLGRMGAEFDEVLRATLEARGLSPVIDDLGVSPEPGRLFSCLPTGMAEPSVSVHACHGPMREVEVLHDELLALLTRRDDPVAPEDVMVLVPDLPSYVPLVEAVFGRDRSDPRFIPFHVADRSSRMDSPAIDALDRLLGMVKSRVTAAEVSDLLVLGPIHGRLGLDPPALDKLKVWIVESGIRWGMDAEHRQALGVPASDANTWRFGLDRLLVGYALPGGGERIFENVLPYDEIEGKDAELLGNFAGFVRTLFTSLRELERPRALPEWSACIAALSQRFFERDRDTLLELARVERALAELARTAETAGFAGDLDVSVVRELVRRKLDSGSPERGFLGAGVNFCAMVPMRSIPFRVIALLGLNDGKFPRAPRPLEFDLAHDGRLESRAGDRSPRSDDRYLFLETLCAARERLIVTYSGKSIRDNRSTPPSVCVSELYDHLAARNGVTREAVERTLVVEHRLQGFSPSYFDGSEPRLRSYAAEYARAASALATGSRSAGPFVGELSELPKPAVVTLDDLVRFWKSPPAYLLNRRLGVYLESNRVELRDREPLELEALDAWKIGDPLIEHAVHGRPLGESERLFRGRGALPLGPWGSILLKGISETSSAIARLAETARAGSSLPPLAGRVKLPNGIDLDVSVDCRFAGGFVVATYSKLKPKGILTTWLRHLAASALGSSTPSFLVGRDPKPSGTARVIELARVSPDEAKALLGELVEWFVRGQRIALPFLPAVSEAYARALLGGKSHENALDSASNQYRPEPDPAGGFDPHAVRAFDQRLPPFDAAYERSERALDATLFHAVALSVHRPLFGAGGSLG
ncbi:MAG TPA: exodeoxyribonuclease V subunit gamma [Polyangiaceae bacterium]|nr:exodeoxyribonuclease V subunit gamma [Polyangiaceae bacterium]